MYTAAVTGISQCKAPNIPLSAPEAMSRKAGTVKSLSSASLDPETVRVNMQEMRPLVKDPVVIWNPVWS